MRGPIRTPLRAIAVAVAATMLLASCGSSGKSASGSGSTSTTAAGSTSTTSSGSGSPTTVKSFSGSGSGEFCSLVHGSADKVTSGTLPPNPLDWKSTFEEVQKSLNEVKTKAPAEIKGDLDTISNAYDQLVSALDNANGNFAQIGTTLRTTFGSGQLRTALENFRNYLVNVCHLDLPHTTPST
jgi:hypothetical protein